MELRGLVVALLWEMLGDVAALNTMGDVMPMLLTAAELEDNEDVGFTTRLCGDTFAMGLF